MKIKTTQKVEKEVEVELPYFIKSEYTGTIMAVLSETSSVSIREREITTYNHAQPIAQFIGQDDYKQITAEEFTTAFDNHIEKLGQLKSLFFKPQTA